MIRLRAHGGDRGRTYAAPPAAAGTVAEHPALSASRVRRRILFLTPWHPEPVDNGSKIRARAIVNALVREYDVVLVSLLPPDLLCDDELPEVPGVWRQYGLALPEYRPRSAKALLAGMRSLPRSMVVTWDTDVARTVHSIATSLKIDLALAADLRVVRYLSAVDEHIPAVLDEANVSPFVPVTSRFSLRGSIRTRKYRTLLADMQRRNALVIVPSIEEADAYVRITGAAPPHVIENGVIGIPATTWTPPASARLLYTGSLTYAPNEEAMLHFALHIMPRIEELAGPVELVVTGEKPELIPAELQQARITITGRLPGLANVYRDARVFISPLLSGTGTRTKILEALSYGLPVVTTSKGVEGLAAHDGEHLLVADAPDDFARAVVRLMNDDALSVRLGQAGRRLVEDRYTWDSRVDNLSNLIEQHLASRDRKMSEHA